VGVFQNLDTPYFEYFKNEIVGEPTAMILRRIYSGFFENGRKFSFLGNGSFGWYCCHIRPLKV